MLIYYTALGTSTYLYIPTPTIPDITNNTVSISDRNVIGWTPWIDRWFISAVFSGTNIVRQTTNFTLYMQNPSCYSPFTSSPYSSTATQDEFVLLKFTPKFIIDPFNTVPIMCVASECSEAEIFYQTGIIRFRHQRTMGCGNYTFRFINFPTSAYAITNQAVKLNV